jgi:glycosyltransferase involved in cell wall biosynthesis
MVNQSEPEGAVGENRAARPLFSIIVPVYEQWHLVPALLSAIVGQERSISDVEVLLVDNGSKGAIGLADLPAFARILTCAAPGSYAARNVGAGQARGLWLLFTDADCRPDRGWLAAFETAIHSDRERVSLLAGAVNVVGAGDAPNWCEVYDMVRGIPQAHYVRRGYAATANLAVPKAVFDALGGFDDRRFSGGDAEFCRRAGSRGVSIRYVADAAVAHPARDTWTELSTKARRVKGGQLTAGSLKRRILWHIATLVPPFRESFRLLRSESFPLRYRIIAAAVQNRLWLVQVAEMSRLLSGKAPERR